MSVAISGVRMGESGAGEGRGGVGRVEGDEMRKGCRGGEGEV